MQQQKKRLQYLCMVKILKQTLLPIPLFPESLQSLASSFHCDSSAIPLSCCGFLPASVCLIAALQPWHCNSLCLCSFLFTLTTLCPPVPGEAQALAHQCTRVRLWAALSSCELGFKDRDHKGQLAQQRVTCRTGNRKEQKKGTSKISPLLKTWIPFGNVDSHPQAPHLDL